MQCGQVSSLATVLDAPRRNRWVGDGGAYSGDFGAGAWAAGLVVPSGENRRWWWASPSAVIVSSSTEIAVADKKVLVESPDTHTS